jgi:hypothetical protein
MLFCNIQSEFKAVELVFGREIRRGGPDCSGSGVSVMNIETLQRAADAAGFATASDDNQDAPDRSAKIADAAITSYPASLLAGQRKALASSPTPSVATFTVWSRASLGQFIPTWAVKA